MVRLFFFDKPRENFDKFHLGNLALARALGDFEFKKNYSLTPDKQIITSNPDITQHDITEDDEFFVLACDGIWDCLSSQHVVDFVRREVAQGKPMGEICETIMEHCLAPDTHGAQGIGCDNMTILIVAILNGKTEEEWYAMVKDRVEKKSGFNTPEAPPQIYSAARLMSWRTRRANLEALEREDQEQGVHVRTDPLSATSLDHLTRVITDRFGAGISFRPGGGIRSDAGAIMFQEENDEEGPPDGPIPPILAGRLSENFVEPETPEDLEQEEFMDDDEEEFKPFNTVIYLSQAEKDRAESRANGVHDPSTPSSTSTQEPPSPPPDTPRGENSPSPQQLASKPSAQKLPPTLPDGDKALAAATVEC
jgi:protein phosphatase 2C family protein 2/3